MNSSVQRRADRKTWGGGGGHKPEGPLSQEGACCHYGLPQNQQMPRVTSTNRERQRAAGLALVGFQTRPTDLSRVRLETKEPSISEEISVLRLSLNTGGGGGGEATFSNRSVKKNKNTTCHFLKHYLYLSISTTLCVAFNSPV